MRTVHPAIVIGAYGWDQDRLPRDEFAIRMDELYRAMDANGWTAMVIHGDAQEHAALVYYTNFVPRLRWAMALVPRRGEPVLLASMSARDVPAMKLMTWIADVRSGWDWGGGFDEWLAHLPQEGVGRIGAVGFDVIAGTLDRAIAHSLGNRFALEDASFAFPRGRALRPRELSLTRAAANLVTGAARAMVAAWRGGSGAEAAALAGERAARAHAAQDVRTLVSLDGGHTLVPYLGRFDAKADPLVGYIAVKAAGYWAELFVTASERANPLLDRVEAGLAAAIAAMRPGADGAAVHSAATAALGTATLHPVLEGSVGRRIGLSLNDGGDLHAAGGEPVAAGSVYALHVGAAGAIASALVAVGSEGADVLCRSADVIATGPAPK